MAKSPTPYRALTPERRLSLVTSALAKHKGARTLYSQRLAAKGGGFRAATLISWPVDKLAREFVRLNAQTPQDELELLQLLYVDLEPPYADADAVARGAAAVLTQHGDEGRHYLRTLVVYNLPSWPGLDTELAKTETAS